MAVGRYRNLPEDAQLDQPAADAARVATLLAGRNYQHVLLGLGEYSTVEHVRTSLSGWSRDVQLGDDDAVVFYFAGHGVVADRDRHYLMCWASDEDDPATSALATEDLIRILTRTGLRNLLVVLDTCYGGEGAADGARIVLRTIARRLDGVGSGGVWMLSSARAKDEARDGAFVESLLAALDEVRDRTGQRQRYLDLVDIVDAVNRRFERRDLRQRAELVASMVTGLAPFLDNDAYRADLPAAGDTDLELQRLLAKRDLHDHFGPRSRGVEYDSEPGLYFSGRERLLNELVSWLTGAQPSGNGRVVTGSPGCGKSAVLGRIVAMSDPAYRQTLLCEPGAAASGLPPRLVSAAVHARHKLLPQVVQQLASELDTSADGPGELLREVSLRARDGASVVIVVDALDEAGSGTAADAGGKGEPRRIARELLRPLSEVPGVRLLVGTRHELVPSLGSAMEILDLDDHKYLGGHDIAGYVTKVLLAENEPDVITPYRGRRELARTVGAAVADRAAGVFLVARMTARGLRAAESPVDVTRPGWQDDLPSEIGEAFEDYLSWFGERENIVRSLLTPLAFAEGQGLPRGQIWTRIATELSGRPYGEDDIDLVLDKAAAYVAEISDHGRSVYRLYHQALAEHLRANYKPGVERAQRSVVDALLATVPRGADDEADWFSAHRYVRAYLATHAAAADRLDEVVADPGFLLAAEQFALVSAFPRVHTEAGRHARSAYEQAAHQLAPHVPLGERAAYLQLSCRRCGAEKLADRVDGLGVAMPWRTRWAWWSPTGVHRQLVGHEKPITSLASGDMDGRPIALTGSQDGTARIWDLVTLRQLGEPLRPGCRWVTAVVVGELGEYTIAVTGGNNGELWVWDLSSSRALGGPFVGHTNTVSSIALTIVDQRTVAVSASKDGTVRVWDVESGRQVGEPFIGHRSPVNALTLAELDGRTVAVTGGDDTLVWVWDLATRQPIGGPLIGHSKEITAVAMARVGGRDLVVTGSKDGRIALWDFLERHQVGSPLDAHEALMGGVSSVATGMLGAVPIAISSGRNIGRVWNLSTRQQIGQPLTGHDGPIRTALVRTVYARPTAVTAGRDEVARVWDLTADQPLTGHTGAVKSVTIRKIGDRSLALTGGRDGTGVLWDLDAGGVQDGPPLAGHFSTVTAVALGELKGRPVAVTGSADATIVRWDLNGRQRIGGPLAAHTGPVTAIEFCNFSGLPMLVTGSTDGSVRLWDLATGKSLGQPLTGHHADVDLLAVSEVDGRMLVMAGTRRSRVSVWDLGTRRQVTIEQADPDRWKTLAVGRVLGKVAAVLAGDDNTLLLWDLMSGCPMTDRMVGHTDMVELAVLGERDGRPILMTGGFDLTIRFWDLKSGLPLGVPLHGDMDGLFGLAVGPSDDGVAAISVGRRQTRLWSLTSFHQVGEALAGRDAYTIGLAVGELHDRTIVVSVGYDGTVRVRDLVSGNPVGPALNGHKMWINGVYVTDMDGPVVITTGVFDGVARVWDLLTYRERLSWAHTVPPVNIGDMPRRQLVAYQRRGRPSLAIAAGASAQIWDLETRALVTELTGHTGRILWCAKADVQGRQFMLTGAIDATARLWDLDDLCPVGEPLEGHDRMVKSVVLRCEHDKLIAFTGDYDGVVRAWDALSGQQLNSPFPKASRMVTVLECGEVRGNPVLVIGGSNGLVRVWCLATEQVVAQAQLTVAPEDVVLRPDGDMCIATAMGIVTLNISDWTTS
jgi:WD40 repeat protein